jgi:hypothetical protein
MQEVAADWIAQKVGGVETSASDIQNFLACIDRPLRTENYIFTYAARNMRSV